jgi:glycosyltransferase involved in cell wall biosynthesis
MEVDVMSPTISVIIPVFNGVEFVARSIQSALAQTHQPDEIIVVDDGSVDETQAMLADYSDRIKLIKLATNYGVSNARNVGIRASSGTLLAFLDADDIWREDKLALQVAALAAHPNAGFCCSDFRVLNRHQGRMVSHLGSYRHPELALDAVSSVPPLRTLLRFNFVGTSTVLMRRSVAREVGWFSTQLPQAEDYDYWLRCAQATQFLVLSPPLVDKITHAANLTNNGLETFLCHEKVLQNFMASHPDWDMDVLGLPNARARVHYEIGHQLFNRQMTRAAFASYLRGARSDPSIRNVLRFFYLALKKTIRLASFDLIHRPQRHPLP